MPTLAAEDLDVIERRAAALGDCRLIVFDPISAYIAGRDSDVRRALTPLRDLAARLGAAVLLITHHSKRAHPPPTASTACSARSRTSASAAPTSCSSRTPTTPPAIAG